MYQFKLKWWLDDKPEEICGLVAGNSYPEALTNLMKYAEGENIIECALKELGEFDNIITYNDNSFDISGYLN